MSKNWSWKGTELIKDKKFACLDNPVKIFGTKWSNPVKLYRKRKVWYVLCVIFNC